MGEPNEGLERRVLVHSVLGPMRFVLWFCLRRLGLLGHIQQQERLSIAVAQREVPSKLIRRGSEWSLANGQVITGASGRHSLDILSISANSCSDAMISLASFQT